MCLPYCLRWWNKPTVNLSEPSLSSSYWPAPLDGWAVGHAVSVPTSALDFSSPRKLGRIEFLSEYNKFADVIFPIDPAHPTQRLRSRVAVFQLAGCPIATDLATVEWPQNSSPGQKYGPKRPRSPSVPLDLTPNAMSEVVEPRARVLSDPSSCLSGPSSKLRRLEQLEDSAIKTDVLNTDEEAPVLKTDVLNTDEEAPVLKTDEDEPVLKTDQDTDEGIDTDQFFNQLSPVF